MKKIAKTARQFKNLIILAAAVLIVLFAAFNVHIIPTGYTGARTKCGQIDEKPVQSGQLIITAPFVEDVSRVNNKQQDFTVKGQIWGETDDKTPVYAEGVTVTYQILPERSVWIFANVADYRNHLITEPLVGSSVKSAMVELSPKDVTDRSKIEPLVQEKLAASLDGKYGEETVRVCKVTIPDMDFDEKYNDAIQAKSIAAQEQAKAKIENETKVADAEAKKQVRILEAEGKAEQTRIAAEAESEANRLIRESLTPELIEMKKASAWDGKLPAITGGAIPLFDAGGFLGDTGDVSGNVGTAEAREPE